MEKNSFYFRFETNMTDILREGEKFLDCDCIVEKIEDESHVTVKACEYHIKTIKTGQIKHIQFGPAIPQF